ncbi:MAG: hypothetical protein KME29_11940 [Calothrix sp. FI2-JRJ7]|nr:hypothetical protein [Calothrix sp. FI2-JRJ7]
MTLPGYRLQSSITINSFRLYGQAPIKKAPSKQVLVRSWCVTLPGYRFV